jgi:hypothetical protein
MNKLKCVALVTLCGITVSSWAASEASCEWGQNELVEHQICCKPTANTHSKGEWKLVGRNPMECGSNKEIAHDCDQSLTPASFRVDPSCSGGIKYTEEK